MEPHYESMQLNSGGGLFLATSCLSGRFWTGALSFFSEFKDSLDVEKRLAATKLDMGVTDLKLINDTSLLLATDSGGLHWWSLQEQEQQLGLVAEPQEHDDIISALDISTDKASAISGGHDNKVVIWDVEEAIAKNHFKGHAGKLNGISCSPVESDVFLSCSQDGTILMWDLRLSKPAKMIDHMSWFGSSVVPTAVCWQPASQHIFAAGSECGQVAMVDLRNTSQNSSKTHPHARSVTRVVFDPAHTSSVASVGEDCKVALSDFSKDTPEIKYTDSRHTDFPRAAFWRENQLVTCGWDSQVIVHSLGVANGSA